MSVCVLEDFIHSTLNTVNEQVAMKTQIKDCKSQIKHCLRFMCYCLMCVDCPASLEAIYTICSVLSKFKTVYVASKASRAEKTHQTITNKM